MRVCLGTESESLAWLTLRVYRIPLSGTNVEIVRREWPFEDDALNYAAIHPFLVAFAERIRGSSDILMNHGAIVGKYAGKGDYDQLLHTDHPHRSSVVPLKSNANHDLPMIIYHSDVTVDLGPTYVVSWEYTEPRKLVNRGKKDYTRETMPELYEKEVPVTVPAGSAIIYSSESSCQGPKDIADWHIVRTWHRGSAMKAKEGARFTQFTGFHANDPWLSPTNQLNTFGGLKISKFLSRAEPGQRTLVGFPPVGHEYWQDEDAFEAVGNRYPEMDLRPYGGPGPKVGR